MRATNGGFLISQVKQVQGRVFDAMLQEAGIEEFNGAQGRILYILWQTAFEACEPVFTLNLRLNTAQLFRRNIPSVISEELHRNSPLSGLVCGLLPSSLKLHSRKRMI